MTDEERLQSRPIPPETAKRLKSFDAWQAFSFLEQTLGGADGWRFGIPVTLAFPDREVDGLKVWKRQRWIDAASSGAAGDALRLDVNLPGLVNPGGPAPLHFAEAVYRERLRGNESLQDFLDIFQHRFLRLWFDDARAMSAALGPGQTGHGHDAAGGQAEQEQYDSAALCAFALAGALAGGLRGMDCGESDPFRNPVPGERGGALPDECFLGPAALWSLPEPSAAGLEKLLETCLGLRVRVEQFHGAWLPVALARRTFLGVSNHSLGDRALLGGQAFDASAGVLILPRDGGAIPREFFPGEAGSRRAELSSLVRAYAGEGVAVCFADSMMERQEHERT